jgi:hypothetical protein
MNRQLLMVDWEAQIQVVEFIKYTKFSTTYGACSCCWEAHTQVAGIIQNSNTSESAAAAGWLGGAYPGSWDQTEQQYL